MVEDKSGNRKYGARQNSHFTKKKDDDDDGFVWEQDIGTVGVLAD